MLIRRNSPKFPGARRAGRDEGEVAGFAAPAQALVLSVEPALCAPGDLEEVVGLAGDRVPVEQLARCALFPGKRGEEFLPVFGELVEDAEERAGDVCSVAGEVFVSLEDVDELHDEAAGVVEDVAGLGRERGAGMSGETP